MNPDKGETLTKLIPANKEKKCGLAISVEKSKVVVGAIDADSLFAGHLNVDDCIVSINGASITDKTGCKQILEEASNTNKDIEIVIERSVRTEASPEPVLPPTLPDTPNNTTEPVLPPPEPASMPAPAVSDSNVVTKTETVVTTQTSSTSTNSQCQPATPITSSVLPPTSVTPSAKPPEPSEGGEFDLGFQPQLSAQIKKRVSSKVQSTPQVSLMELDDEFNMGNPLDGLTFPMPLDVREILRKRIPEIIANYEKIDEITTEDKSAEQSYRSTKSTKSSAVRIEDKKEEQPIASDMPKKSERRKKKKG